MKEQYPWINFNLRSTTAKPAVVRVLLAANICTLRIRPKLYRKSSANILSFRHT